MQIGVGDKVRIGKQYAHDSSGRFHPGEVIELVEGTFDSFNGLYDEVQTAPSIWNHDAGEYDSVFHLFGNNFEDFADCELIKAPQGIVEEKQASAQQQHSNIKTA
jgi:hypothetical protein